MHSITRTQLMHALGAGIPEGPLAGSPAGSLAGSPAGSLAGPPWGPQAALPAGVPELLWITAREAAGLQERQTYRPQEVAALANALLELTELAADEVGMEAFEGALDEELDASLDDILGDFGGAES